MLLAGGLNLIQLLLGFHIRIIFSLCESARVLGVKLATQL